MAQYTTGTVSVVNGSNIVTGSGTAFLANVIVGNSFNISGDNVVYTIASVDSDTQIKLSIDYEGISSSGSNYQISTSFTPNLGLYEVGIGDKDWPINLTQKTIRKLDKKLSEFYVSPEDFGAKGNGNDDTEAVLECINNHNGREVLLLQSYLISSSLNLTSPITIRGLGRNSPSEFLVNSSFNSNLINVLSEGVTLKDFSLRHSSDWKQAPANSVGICIGEASDYKWGVCLQNLAIRRFDTNVRLDGSVYGNIQNVHFWDAKTFSLHIRNILEPEGGDNFVNNCIFNDFEPSYEIPASDTLPWDNLDYIPVESHIYQENSSGLYLFNNKIHWGKRGYYNFNNSGISKRTTVVLINNNSLEGQDGRGQIEVDATGTNGQVQNLLIHNNEMNARENCEFNVKLKGVNKLSLSGNTGSFYRGTPVGSICLSLETVTKMSVGENTWIDGETGVYISSDCNGTFAAQNFSGTLNNVINDSQYVNNVHNVPVGINTQNVDIKYPLTVAQKGTSPTTQVVVTSDKGPAGLFLTSGDKYGGFFSSNTYYDGQWKQATAEFAEGTAFGVSKGATAIWHYEGSGLNSTMLASRSAYWTKGRFLFGDGVPATSASEVVEVLGNVKANYFLGDGSLLTNIPGHNSAGTSRSLQVSDGAGGFSWVNGATMGTDGTISTYDLTLSATVPQIMKNDLTSTDTNKALTAMQGKILSDRSPVLASSQIAFSDGIKYTGDSTFIWDNTNKRLGIGISPITPIDIYKTTAGPQLLIRDEVTSAVGGGGLSLRHTNSSDAYAASGDRLGFILFGSRSSGVNRNGSLIESFAEETFTSSVCGSYLKFSTVTAGSTTIVERMKIDSSGNVRVGADATNNVTLNVTNGIVLNGTSTVWKDVFFVMGQPLLTGAGNPSLVTWNTPLRGFAFAVNDAHDFNPQEFPHDGKQGAATGSWHIHWISRTNVAATRGVKWQLEYCIADVNGVFPAPTTISVDVTVAANTADKTHLISTIGTFTTPNIAAQIYCRLTRIASAGTAPANDPVVIGVHFHYEVDTLGSQDLLTK